jgi:folylpolyglutamate synthase/dihydropteroate synthase
LAGDFQRTNAALAVALVETFLAAREGRHAAHAEEGGGGREGGGGLPLYAPTSPLAPALLEGLRTVRWSGRAQVLDVPVPAGAPGSGSSSVRLYVDGAHTERSLQACAGWYRGELAAAGGEGAEGEEERVLLFYCGAEKDALQLLLPLSALPFHRVVLAAPAWTRPSRHAVPSTAEALAQFVLKKERMGDARAVAEVEEGAARAGISPAELRAGKGAEEAAAAAAVAPVTGSPWLHTLADLWSAVHTRPEFAVIRARLAQPLREYDAGGGGEEAEAPPPPPAAALPLPALAPPVEVAASIADALAALQARAAARPGVRLRVLVTASLYLVGGVLEALGWKEG